MELLPRLQALTKRASKPKDPHHVKETMDNISPEQEEQMATLSAALSYSPLILAAQRGNVELCGLLLRHGARPVQLAASVTGSVHGLYAAAASGSLEVVELLLEGCSTEDVARPLLRPRGEAKTVLEVAQELGHESIVGRLRLQRIKHDELWSLDDTPPELPTAGRAPYGTMGPRGPTPSEALAREEPLLAEVSTIRTNQVRKAPHPAATRRETRRQAANEIWSLDELDREEEEEPQPDSSTVAGQSPVAAEIKPEAAQVQPDSSQESSQETESGSESETGSSEDGFFASIRKAHEGYLDGEEVLEEQELPRSSTRIRRDDEVNDEVSRSGSHSRGSSSSGPGAGLLGIDEGGGGSAPGSAPVWALD